MKKIYMCLISLVGLYGHLQAQHQFQGVNFGDTSNPVPSLASLAGHTDTPPSVAVGIPEISVPLFSISGYGGSDFGLQLSYNPTGVSADDAASEVGAGWSMFKGGVISRKINGIMVDEAFQNTASAHYEKNVFDDEYYYSLPGFSGKFKIERDTVQNTFRIVDLTPLNHVKIAYTKQNNTATLVIDSFTITDDDGSTYYFNDYSTAAVYDSFYDEKGLWGWEYKSAFFLTRITNADGVETANFTYQKNTKYDTDNTTLLYKSCQLQKINTALGNIEIVYDYDQTLEKTMNDPYSIKKVMLNNFYGKVAEYAFDYSYPFPSNPGDATYKKRQLDKIKKMDGQNILEETAFLYNPLSLEVPTGGSCQGSVQVDPSGVLNKIIYPTKGVTQYLYEGSEIYADKSSAAYLESLTLDYVDSCTQEQQEFLNFSFDTHQTLTYSFTIPGDSSKKKTFWVNYGDVYTSVDPNTGEPIILPPVPENKRITYTLKRGTEVLTTNQKGSGIKFYNYPGQYTVTANVPLQNGQVNFGLIEVVAKPGPYRNASPSTSYRIRSIKRFNSINSSIPVKEISYKYDDFSIPNASSGYTSKDGRILFKNVKVMDGSGNGYAKYFFKLDKDYPSYQTTVGGNTVNFQPYYNLLRSGILEKKEMYSETNQLLGKDDYQYTFGIADNVDYQTDEGFYSKTAFISQTKSTSIAYPSGSAASFLQTSSENNVRADNYKPSSSKTTAADGTVTESFYKYAQDKNLTKLLADNMTGMPVETEVKEAGKTIGKSETKFDHSANVYPSSVIGYNRQNQSPFTASTLDVYDNKGNLVQVTGKNGIPTTTIWGYYQTLPIAVISGASYSQVASLSTVTAAIAASNADRDNPANEPALIQALENLRKDPALKNYTVTATTYDPLVGVTNSISANGIRTVNTYDNAGRLIKVKDADGKTLQENQYNYKH
jgi:YD repeat-containing protein